MYEVPYIGAALYRVLLIWRYPYTGGPLYIDTYLYIVDVIHPLKAEELSCSYRENNEPTMTQHRYQLNGKKMVLKWIELY